MIIKMLARKKLKTEGKYEVDMNLKPNTELKNPSEVDYIWKTLLTFVVTLFLEQATELKHPSGCAMIVHVHGSGWGWFGTLLVMWAFFTVLPGTLNFVKGS